MREARFQLIIDETKTGKILRKMLPVSYGLGGLFLLCGLVPAMRLLSLVAGALWLSVLGIVAAIDFSKAKQYVLGGMIQLTEDGILLNRQVIKITDLRQVEVKFNTPRGRSAGRNGIGDAGNRIIIYPTTSGEAAVATVLVETKAQRDNLAGVLQAWRKLGVKVWADGVDLV